jgi:putative transposase
MTWMREVGGTIPAGAPSGAKKHFHGHDLRNGRYSCPGQIYLVTTVTYGRERLFEDYAWARTVVHALRCASEQGLAHTHAYVVMPDHLHWLMSLGETQNLSGSS